MGVARSKNFAHLRKLLRLMTKFYVISNFLEFHRVYANQCTNACKMILYISLINQTRTMYMSNVMIYNSTDHNKCTHCSFKRVQGALLLGPRFLPKVATTFTNLRLYCIRLLARPVLFFFFSIGSTWSGHTAAQGKREGRVTPPHLGQTIYLNFTKGSVRGSYNNVAMATITAPGLRTYLWRLSSDLAGTSQGAVNFTCGERNREQALNDATQRVHVR